MKRIIFVFGVLAATLIGAAQAQFTVGGVTGGAPTTDVNCYGDADGKILAYSSGWTAADCGIYSQVCNANQFTCPPANTLCTNGEFCVSGPYVSITTPDATQGAFEIATNVAPVMDIPNCPSAVVDADFSCAVSAVDANGNPITYALTNTASWMQFNTQTGVISGRPSSVADVENINVTAKDNYNATSPSVNFSILVINNAPTIGVFNCTNAMRTLTYSCTVGGYDQDGHTLTYTATNLPTWATLDTATGLISGTPTTIATHSNITMTVSDAYSGSATTAAFNILVVAGPVENAADDIAAAIIDGDLMASDVNALLAAKSLTADSDLDLAGNPVHLAYVAECIGSKTDPDAIAACATSVDGGALSRYEISEVVSGSMSGNVDAALLVKAGISSDVSTIAAGNSCGPNQDQSCLTLAFGDVITSSDNVTQSTFENVLVNYFENAVAEVATTVPAHTVKACPGGPTSFAVPNAPPLCSSFAHWNCTSNTTGISVQWTDNGKGNVLATTEFSGGAYQLTASMTIGSTTRTRPLTGKFNINSVSSAYAAGYRTGWQPGYWGNPFNPLSRAAGSCASQGGTLAKHSEIRAANTQFGTIIPNGTRVIFRAENGDAEAYTGTSTSSTKPQCSNDFHQTNGGNIKGFQYRKNNYARCDGRSRSENFTFMCKDVPTSCN